MKTILLFAVVSIASGGASGQVEGSAQRSPATRVILPTTTANFCAPLVEDPRGQIAGSELLFVGTTLSNLASGYVETPEFDVEVVWNGELAPGDVVCLPVRPNGCERPSAKVGERYLLWSPCNLKECQSRHVRDGWACVAYPLPAKEARLFFEYVTNEGPPLGRREVSKRLSDWQSDRTSASALLAWVEYVNRYRDVSDRNEQHQSLLLGVLWNLSGWLAGAREPAAECKLKLEIAGDLLTILATERRTLQAELDQWRDIVDRRERRAR